MLYASSLTDAEQNALSYFGQSRVSEELPGTCFVASSLAALALGKPIILRNPVLTSLTNITRTQPVGFSYDFQYDYPTAFSHQLANVTRQLRTVCFPSFNFSKCAFYKGCHHLAARIQHTAVEGDGVVVMWQHDIANPPLHISSVPWSDQL